MLSPEETSGWEAMEDARVEKFLDGALDKGLEAVLSAAEDCKEMVQVAAVETELVVVVDVEVDPLQERSNGSMLGPEPTIAKLGLGVVGVASLSVNHQVLTLTNCRQPASSQYVFAFSRLKTARFYVFPLTGHTVSVI